MSDDIIEGPTEGAPPPKKRGKKLIILIALLTVVGGGAAAGLYATGMIGGEAHAAVDDRPKLVPKSEQKRIAAGEGGEGAGPVSTSKARPGGDKYASNYFAFDKDFTSNLSDSERFVQVGVAVSTNYDDTVIENIKTNEIAVRSAVLMALGDATEEEVADERGKKRLQARLAKAINTTLQEKEGFGGVGNVYFTNFVVQ